MEINAQAFFLSNLLLNTYHLLNEFPDVLYKYQNKFKYILVDEYQDTNHVQYLIIKKLAALNENICVVGDDAQSIYSFRGANIQNMKAACFNVTYITAIYPLIPL